MITLDSPITALPGVGAATAKNLSKLGIKAVSDLLFYYPYKYLDFSVFSKIKDARPEQTVTIRGTIKTIASRYSFKSRMSLCEAIISDDTGSLKVIWFNQPYIKDYLNAGDEVLLSGKPNFYKSLQLSNPIYEKVSDDTTHTGRIVPVYHLKENIYNKSIRNLIKQNLKLSDEIPESIPQLILDKFNLLKLNKAIKQIHFPDSESELEQAKLRVSFDEAFVKQLAVQLRIRELRLLKAPAIKPEIKAVKAFLQTLPFTLTAGQKSAAWQIMQDMATGKPMNRLLEGDVGSGKTLVAILSMLSPLAQGYQVSLMAPTEILARQHYETISSLLGNNYSTALLTNHYKLVNKQETDKKSLLTEIKKGRVNVIIGTHALLYGVEFKKLALIVVDEQHRFGVQQRAALLKTKNTKEKETHLLSMTATPIPRTLALALFSDLQISTLKQVPSGRKPIITKVIPEDSRAEVYKFIHNEIKTGRQSFIITPRVEETGAALTKPVKSEFKRLQAEVYPKLKLGLLYGAMKGNDKEKVMTDFHEKKIDILVATSVIEIGIDVPNATTMIIEGAQNFGLAQLHQLRGRVGRGQEQSYCFLFSDSSDEHTLARLNFFSKCNDGFKLAEQDLQERGFGDLFGDSQSGFNYKFSRFLTIKTLGLAKNAANFLLDQDPSLSSYEPLAESARLLKDQIHLE
jgi:ATP-dependent DNA helicase RecG